MPESKIIAFYRGHGVDHAGRRIDEIWRWDHRRLELVHDFIQWLFPLPDPSRFNPDAPLLTADDCAVFQMDSDLQRRVLGSLDLMLDFLGLQRSAGRVEPGPTFAARAAGWLEPLNHNYLRLTRILLFLRHVGRVDDARALLDALEAIALAEGRGKIDLRTLRFWRDAAPPR